MNPETSATLTERRLLHIWRSQSRHVTNLKTTDGRNVEVVRCGRWNFDTGPDFKAALLRIGNQLKQGDVEIHLRTSEWYAHGHEKDPHYNEVILHVVWWEDLGGPIVRQDRQEVPNLVLKQFLRHPLDEPGRAFPSQGTYWLESQQTPGPGSQPEVPGGIGSTAPCLTEVKMLPREKLLELLEERADTRFQRKIQRFAARWKDQDWDQLIYGGLLEALGYPINKKPFLKLAQLLPLPYLEELIPAGAPDTAEGSGTGCSGDAGGLKESRLLWIQALLLGVAGLLPATSAPGTGTPGAGNFDPETKAYLDELTSLWEMLRPCFADKVMQPEEWQFFRVRPFNSPISRLSRFSFVLASRTGCSRWITEYVNLLMAPTEGKNLVKALEASLLAPVSGYWASHTGFGTGRARADQSSSRSPRTLRSVRVAIGSQTVREMIINVILPILYVYAEKTSRAELQEKISRLYKSYPAPACNSVTKFMIKNLFKVRRPRGKDSTELKSSTHPGHLAQEIRYARTHQGLIQLHTELCQMEGCPSCPYRTF